MMAKGEKLITSGTDTHLVMWDLRQHGLTGSKVEKLLDDMNITTNKNSIVGDKSPALSVGDVICRVNPKFYRPAEVETLLGDPSKAKRLLGWSPNITVQQMCAEMVSEDLIAAKRHVLLSL